VTWPTVKLGSLMPKSQGSVNPQQFPNETFELYSIPAFDKGAAEIVKGQAIGSTKQVVSPNDILISKIVPHIRRAWVVDDDNGLRKIASGEWIVFQSSKLSTSYFRHFLLSDIFHRQFMSTVAGMGGSLLRAKPSLVSEFHMKLPPLAEQQRIAAILDKAEEIKRKREQAIAKLDLLAQSTFVEMFSNKNFDRQPLKALGIIKTGGTPPSSQNGMFDGDIPFITPGDLAVMRGAKRTVTSAGAKESVTVREGSALVCCIGATIGKMDKAKSYCAFNQQINAVEWNDLINDDYGIAAMNSIKNEIISSSTSTTLPILKKSLFERLEIPVPPLSVQIYFSNKVKLIHKNTQLQLYGLDKENILFQSLQHQAFTTGFHA